MEWIVSPIDGIEALNPILKESCPQSFATYCFNYFECNCAGTMLVHQKPA